MERVRRFYNLLYHAYIKREYDRFIPIIAEEGEGKSTFMLESIILWDRILGREYENERVLGQFYYEPPDFKRALAEAETRSMITVPDAARVMHKKQAMHGSQIDLEKDLFDARIGEHVVLLGYQYWSTVPTILQNGRAKNCFVIPKRGTVHGYNRASMDERVEKGEWPEPDLVDSFPAMTGTDIWRQYQKLDREKKEARMGIHEEEEDEESLKDRVDHVVAEIKESGVESVCSFHGGHKNWYIDPALIQYDYDLSDKEAQLVKKLLMRDEGVTIPQGSERGAA